MQRVPQIDSTSLNFAEILVQTGLSSVFVYRNPQYSVLRAVVGSLSQSSTLPIQSPHQNATWSLTFPGPAVECEDVDAGLESRIKQNKHEDSRNHWGTSYGYISWVPTVSTNSSAGDTINHLPFHNDSGEYSLSNEKLGPLLRIPSYGPPQPVETNTSLRLYVAVMPDVLLAEDGNYDSAAESAKIITRQLYNTSYTAKFRYVGGVQHVGLSTAGSYGYTGFSASTAGVQQLSYVIDPGRGGVAYAPAA